MKLIEVNERIYKKLEWKKQNLGINSWSLFFETEMNLPEWIN